MCADGPRCPSNLESWLSGMPGKRVRMVLVLQQPALIQGGLLAWALCHAKVADFNLGPSWRVMPCSSVRATLCLG